MVSKVIFDERLDEVVAVIVARVAAQNERLPGECCGVLQPIRLELALEELVAEPLIDEQRAREAMTVLDERDGIVLTPRRAIGAQVALRGSSCTAAY